MTSSDDQSPDQASAGTPEPGPGVQFNPQSAYPTQPGPVDPNQPQAGYPGYPSPGQPPYPQPPYGQPQYGQPQYPQYAPPPYGQQYPTWPVYGPPNHPKADLAFILGLIGGPVAFVTCGLSLLAAPFAWYFAALVRREVAASPGQYSADTSKVTAGLVLGIIGTALLALGFILVAILIIVAIADPSAFDDGTTV